MPGPKLNYEKASKEGLIRKRGTEFVDDPPPPENSPPTCKEDIVRGVFKRAKKKTSEERAELERMKGLLERWMKAGDVSQLEMDKLKRRIAAVERSLPPLRTRKTGKRKRSEKPPKRKLPK